MRFCKRTLALLAAAVMALALPACTSTPAHSNGPTEFASTEELASYMAQQADAEENQIALFEPQVEEAQLDVIQHSGEPGNHHRPSPAPHLDHWLEHHPGRGGRPGEIRL